MQFISEVLDRCFIRRYAYKYVSREDSILVFKVYEHYFIVAGESLLFEYLKNPVKDVKISILPHHEFEIEEYITINKLAHAKSDS